MNGGSPALFGLHGQELGYDRLLINDNKECL